MEPSPPPLLPENERVPGWKAPEETAVASEIAAPPINAATSGGALAAGPTIGSALGTAVGVVGVLTFGVYLTLAARGTEPPSVGYLLGAALGWLTIRPLIVILLFLLARRFRSLRAAAIILIVTWSLMLFSQVQSLLLVRSDKLLNARLGNAGQASEARTGATSAAEPTGKPADTGDRASAAIDPAAAKEFDFSRGSDQRLVKEIDGAQADRYHRVVAGYRAAVAAKPKDAQLALEWVRFVQHFASAEDVTIEKVDLDYTAAKSHLVQRFPAAPETILFQLEDLYDEDFDAKVQEATPGVAQWPAYDAARFYLIQAQRLTAREKPAQLEALARKSFELEKTPDAAVLLARSLTDRKQTVEAAKVLDAVDFAPATNWLKVQRMNLLFEVGRVELGKKMLAELKRDAPDLVRTRKVAQQLGRAGLVREGRELIAEFNASWNAKWIARQRYEFELEFGDAGQAAAAYAAWRKAGWTLDPFAREWARVLRRHLRAPWSSGALVSTAALAVALLLAAAAPLLLLAPVHHWSLWRRQQGKTAVWPIAPWGLRSAWGLLGLACIGELLAVWYFFPGALP